MPLASLIRLVLLGMIWGASFLFQRITVPAVGVAFTASIRIVLSALMLVLIARVLGLSLQWRTHWRVWLFLGTVNTAIPFLCFAAAARSLPAGYMAVINATVPLLTIRPRARSSGITASIRVLPTLSNSTSMPSGQAAASAAPRSFCAR